MTGAALTEPALASGENVRTEILAQIDDPAGVVGRQLTLVRYTIAPGVILPTHIHPGLQAASVVSGTLTYRVVSGKLTVHRGLADNGQATAIEEFDGPAETLIHPGDAVFENADMQHFGENRTDSPIVILATLLTESDKDLTVVTSAENSP
jgi:quercetin dioxygenase-like cupin family protein